MKLQLNKWQRGTLLAGAALIGWIVYAQFAENGFSGWLWILPVAVALACVLVAITPSQARDEPGTAPTPKAQAWLKQPTGVAGPFDPDNIEMLRAAIAEAAKEVHELVPKTATVMRPVANPKQGKPRPIDIDSDVLIRTLQYGYVVVGVACRRVQRDFQDSSVNAKLYDSFMAMMEHAWWYRHGGIPDDPDKQATADDTISAEFVTAGRYLQDVLHAMTANRAHPFGLLYRHLDQALIEKEEALEAKYAPLTKSLLLRWAL